MLGPLVKLEAEYDRRIKENTRIEDITPATSIGCDRSEDVWEAMGWHWARSVDRP
jgi:hypothetical protein